MNTHFSDGVVMLRPYSMGDVPHLTRAALASWQDTKQWMPWCHENYNEEIAEAWIPTQIAAFEAMTEFSFVVTDVATGAFAGGCSLNQIDNEYHCANLGYWITVPFRGRGYAPRATRLLMQFAFKELFLERIEIIVTVGNSSSVSVAQKVGAVREGIMRHGIRIGDTYHDAIVHSVLRSEFESSLSSSL